MWVLFESPKGEIPEGDIILSFLPPADEERFSSHPSLLRGRECAQSQKKEAIAIYRNLVAQLGCLQDVSGKTLGRIKSLVVSPGRASKFRERSHLRSNRPNPCDSSRRDRKCHKNPVSCRRLRRNGGDLAYYVYGRGTTAEKTPATVEVSRLRIRVAVEVARSHAMANDGTEAILPAADRVIFGRLCGILGLEFSTRSKDRWIQ